MNSTRRHLILAVAIAIYGCGKLKLKPKPLKEKASSLPQSGVPDVVLDLPLLAELHRLNSEAAKRFPHPGDRGFGRIGLILRDKLTPGDYWCSPKNALVFATTGGDGDHYSLLVHDGRIDDKSPVVLTWPSEGSQQIVGENLFDFLCFGIHGGYFQINSVLSESRPVDAAQHWFCGDVDEQDRQLLAFLTSELKLKPWSEDARREKFQRLQQEFLPLVEANAEPE